VLYLYLESDANTNGLNKELDMITEMFTTKEQIIDFLDTCHIKPNEYKIHDDLTVDFFDGKLNLFYMEEIKIIPFKFSGVRELQLAYTSIESLEDLNLPEGIIKIKAYGTPLKNTKGVPSTVEHLDVSDTKIKCFKRLPEGLKELYANNTLLKNTKGVPSTVVILDIYRTKIKTLEGLHEGLIHLDIQSTLVDSTNGIPSTVEKLNIRSTKIKTLENLPPNLKIFRMSDTLVTSTVGIPDSVEYLDISATTGIKELGKLPKSLKTLDMKLCDIKSRKGIKRGVKVNR
jgi:hypothetical protein